MHTSIPSSSAAFEKGLGACCCMCGTPVAAFLGAQQASDDPPFVESGVFAFTGVMTPVASVRDGCVVFWDA